MAFLSLAFSPNISADMKIITKHTHYIARTILPTNIVAAAHVILGRYGTMM